MTFENTKKKLKAEKLPVWFLSIINARGVPTLISKFAEEDVARSIKYLEEQVKFFGNEHEETCFEIKAKAKVSSNGPHSEMTWEFCVPPTKKQEDPNARFNGAPNGYAGLGMLENNYVQRELNELRSEKREVQDKREQIHLDKIKLMIEEKDLEREKALWQKERDQKESAFAEAKKKLEDELERMKGIYNSNTEASKAAFMDLFGNGLFPLLNQAKEALTGDGLSGSKQPKTKKEQLIDSIAANILDGDLTMEEINAIGIHVHKMKQRFEQVKQEETAAA